MMEFPEAVTLARQINETVTGRRMESVAAGTTPHGFAFYSGDPAGYSALLGGRTIGEARALGGMVEIDVEEMRLLLGDGAGLRRIAPGEKRPVRHQFLAELDDGAALCCSIQMYGGIWAFRKETNDNLYYQVACEHPSPLTGLYRERFESLWDGLKAGSSVKALLATEQRIPGLGNGCLQDILFRAGVHPKTKAAALTDEQHETLYHAVMDTLGEMADGGGRDTEKDLFGNPGGYRSILSRKTLAYPCPQCGGGIVRQAFLGGNIYFCPRCQPLN